MCSLIPTQTRSFPSLPTYTHTRESRWEEMPSPCRSPPCPHGLETHGQKHKLLDSTRRARWNHQIFGSPISPVGDHPQGMYIYLQVVCIGLTLPIHEESLLTRHMILISGQPYPCLELTQISFRRLAPPALLPIQNIYLIKWNSQTLYLIPSLPLSLTDKV